MSVIDFCISTCVLFLSRKRLKPLRTTVTKDTNVNMPCILVVSFTRILLHEYNISVGLIDVFANVDYLARNGYPAVSSSL